MRTPTIIYKNLRQRALSTILTACSIALGVALVVAITSLRQQAQENFNSVAGSYELVIGAKGSPLQLVLNTVYHLDVPVGNIPYGYYQTLKNDWRVQSAIPLALGDNYHGFRLVGTEPEYFTQMELQGGKKLTFAAGKSFAADYEAVLGSQTARQTGLKLGDKFVARHGIEDTTITEEHTEHPCTVTGILNETGTPQDRVIFITIGSVHELHVPDPTKPLTGQDLLEALQKLPADQPAATKETDHDHHHRESSPQPPAPSPQPNPEPHSDAPPINEVTSIILKLKSPAFMFQLHREINRGQVAQAAFPAIEVQKLFNIVGTIDRVLLLISALVVVVAAVSILVAIYNSLNERRRDIAIMRALGAHRRTIFGWLLLEAATISALGAVTGAVVGHLVLMGLKGYAYGVSGFPIEPWKVIRIEFIESTLVQQLPGEVVVILVATVLGAVMGLLPAILAYRTNVSTNLGA